MPQNNGVDDEFEEIDEQLINEIEDYLKGVMENNEKLIEMSDSAIGSSGAKCVAAAINFCEGLLELKLSNCSIKDSGACSLFDELANSKTVQIIDMSKNPITERSLDALENMLVKNKQIQQIHLNDIGVKTQFAWNKFKKFGSRVVH